MHNSKTPLEQSTQTFWNISKGFNRPEDLTTPSVTVSEAIKQVKSAQYDLGPHRIVLLNKLYELSDNLIRHGRKPSKTKQHPANIQMTATIKAIR